MSLFFGIYPPEGVVDEAVEIRDRVRRAYGEAKWVEKAKLHVTLQFLGDAERDDAVRVAREVAARNAPFAMTLGGVGDFGHVLWIGVIDPAPLTVLADDLGQELRKAGFTLDDRPYHPHLTIARVKRAPRVHVEGRTSSFAVPAFSLIESRGGQYSTLETFTLARTPTPT